MKSDCVIVNHDNNNIARTPAGFLIPNKSIVTNSTSNLNVYGKQAQVNDLGSANLNGATETCKTYNGTNGALNKQIKSGQFINHFLVASNENNQVRNKVNCRTTNGYNGNPLVLVATSVDANRSLSSKPGTFDGNHELHLNNGINKAVIKKCDGVSRNCINNLDNVNGTFNEKNPGAGGLFDASLVRQVNLAAAFHDHVSYTKIGSEIIKTGGVLSGFNGAPTSKKVQAIQETEVNSHQGNKQQVFKLKAMILTHLDLIQHQQEMLLKKDRQLQGLKQDRESLLSRLEKMEKKMSIMSKKIISLTELSKNPEKTEPQFKSKVCETTKSSGSSSVSSSSSSPIFSDYFSSESASNALFIKLTKDPNSREQEDDYESSDMMVIKSDGQLSSPAKKCKKVCLSPLKSSIRKRNRSGLKLDMTPEVKNASKSTSTSSAKKKVLSHRQKQSSTSSSASSTISSLESEKNDMNDGSIVAEAISKPDEIPFNFMISHDLYEVVNMWDVEELEQEERKRVMSSFKLRNSFPIGISNETENETDSIGEKNVDKVVANLDDQEGNEIPSSEIEVPSWRVLEIPGSYDMEVSENLDDEVYNKRHSKMEIDERRRKRWDIQRLREQKHNEKLKQGRYYSKAAFVSSDIKYQPNSSNDTLKNEPEPVSFFPDPMDAQVIEVCDELPLLAFGHPIPIIPEMFFSIPWNLGTKSDRSLSGSISSKSRKGNDHATLVLETEDHKTTATETTSLTTPKPDSNCQPVPKGAKPFCSAKKMSISVS